MEECRSGTFLSNIRRFDVCILPFLLFLPRSLSLKTGGPIVVPQRNVFVLKSKEAGLDFLASASPFSISDPIYKSPASLLPRFLGGVFPPWLAEAFKGVRDVSTQAEITGIFFRWVLDKKANGSLPEAIPETLHEAEKNRVEIRSMMATRYIRPAPISFVEDREGYRFDFSAFFEPNARIFVPPGRDDVEVIVSILRHLRDKASDLRALIAQTSLLVVGVDATCIV